MTYSCAKYLACANLHALIVNRLKFIFHMLRAYLCPDGNIKVRQSLDHSGAVRKGRALLGSGSMCNLMASDFANTLGLKKEKINIPVSGISDTAFNAKRKSTSNYFEL
ncbi:hypothetical protein AVEN_131168-1 [Araneus ventricosus]|uniref:Uncharacterized protein n=1 Tax=Araneus ventricosus TaxID=182803 RepID=A0A4Y2MNN5_ARAVE|nr:hypothetical protein AVEN_131168-1 [Araneus ventricosus]